MPISILNVYKNIIYIYNRLKMSGSPKKNVCQEKNSDINNFISLYSLSKKEKTILNSLNSSDDKISIKLKLMLLTRLIIKHGVINQDIFNLKECLLEDNEFNSKANCDLDLITLIKTMRLDILNAILTSKDESEYNAKNITIYNIKFNKSDDITNYNTLITNINSSFDGTKYIDKKIYNIDDKTIDILGKKINIDKDFLESITEINKFTTQENKLENINMDEKIHIYTILYILIKTFYTANTEVKTLYKKIVIDESTRCAPRSVFVTEPIIEGGYNNKSGDIEYQICKCNFKQNIKKVSAKSAREAAKIVANKVLKGDKKSITFSLKRIIGKKEKCYDYNASIDKSGKILIKSQ